MKTNHQLNRSGLALLGVDAWVLRSLSRQDLKRFLRDYKKLAAKYFHPDVCRDELRKHAHEYYFKRLMGAMDRLLDDESFLMFSLDELGDGAFERMRSKIVKLENQLRECRQALAKRSGNGT